MPCRILLLLMSLCIAALLATACVRKEVPVQPCSSAAVQEEFRATSEFLLSTSPDGTLTVGWRYRKQQPDHEELVVRQVGSGNILFSKTWPVKVTRVNWRPDSRAIAYFQQDAKTNLRHLFIWDLASDQHRELPIPESHAQALVRWSPDGKRLAFTSDPGGLVIVDPAGGPPVVYPPKIRTFDWSTDGRWLAVVPDENATVATILDATTGAIRRSFMAHAKGVVPEVVWQGSPNLLLLDRSVSTDLSGANRRRLTFSLIALDPSTGKEETLISEPRNIRNIQWLPDGTGCLWHRRDADGTQSIYIKQAGVPAPRRIDLGGTVRFQNFFTDGLSLGASRISDTINQLVRIPLDGGAASVIAEVPSVKLPGLKEEIVKIRSAEETMPPMLVTSIAEGNPRANAAHIVIYGESLAIHNDTWAETQRCLLHGIHSIHLANRRGRAVQDLLAACDYAKTVLKVPRERIVVVGKSEGTKVVMEAALRRPDLFGIIVLTGAFAAPEVPPDSRSRGLSAVRVLAFHGEKDRVVSPERGREAIEKGLGSDALLPPRGMWHIFPNEDHPLHLDESQAVIFATILRELGLIECTEAAH